MPVTSAFFGSPAPVPVCCSTPPAWAHVPPAVAHAGPSVAPEKSSANREPVPGVVPVATPL